MLPLPHRRHNLSNAVCQIVDTHGRYLFQQAEECTKRQQSKQPGKLERSTQKHNQGPYGSSCLVCAAHPWVACRVAQCQGPSMQLS